MIAQNHSPVAMSFYLELLRKCLAAEIEIRTEIKEDEHTGILSLVFTSLSVTVNISIKDMSNNSEWIYSLFIELPVSNITAEVYGLDELIAFLKVATTFKSV